RSTRCACAERSDATTPIASSATSRFMRFLLLTEAGLLMRFRGGGLVSPLSRASTRQGPVGTRLQVHVQIFEIAGDVTIVAHRRHLGLPVGANLFLATGHDEHEFAVAHRPQRLD